MWTLMTKDAPSHPETIAVKYQLSYLLKLINVWFSVTLFLMFVTCHVAHLIIIYNASHCFSAQFRADQADSREKKVQRINLVGCVKIGQGELVWILSFKHFEIWVHPQRDTHRVQQGKMKTLLEAAHQVCFSALECKMQALPADLVK